MNILNIIELKNKILNGYSISKNEALMLENADLQQLCDSANQIRNHFCKNAFDLCSIINGKSGKCSENCKFCAQSSHYTTCSDEYPLLDNDNLLNYAYFCHENNIPRYSIVTSGKCLSDNEIDRICSVISDIKNNFNLSICISGGLLNENQFLKLKNAGVTRIHNNIETSKNFFPNICTTHTYDDKIKTISYAKNAGLEVCSGGIIGMGESFQDRVDMAFQLKELQINSIPLNVLNPIKGTPFENIQKISYDDICRCIAVFRFILPAAFIRMAGGRGLLFDKGERCFLSGANAAITGDMLTTSGISIDEDRKILNKLGFKAGDFNV